MENDEENDELEEPLETWMTVVGEEDIRELEWQKFMI